ncbi:MAG: tetratricopeptide repeat protein [Deltaproteobacteria bacterium]|nr:tetratricopeptide repeat protein [Deltaproteobacteria bacterium]
MGILKTFLFAAAALIVAFLPNPAGGEENLPALIKRIEPSTVVIFSFNAQGKGISQGTGFFVNSAGDVITNYHVLEGASRAFVKVSSGREYPVKKVLAEDREGDLVRVSVEIPAREARPLPVSEILPEVGEKIVIIGTPLGLDKTVSDGIVSAIRQAPDFGEVIQITAPISPGSSGSPVFNMRGEVIGVATFFILIGQNLNFAIPGARVAKLMVSEGRSLPEREERQARELRAEAETAYQTGLRFLWLEDCERAILYFEEAVVKDPEHFEASFRGGYCCIKLKQFERAIPLYKRAIQLKPQGAFLHGNLCLAYGMSGSSGLAVQACRRALELNPELAEAHNNLGWVQHQRMLYAEAIASCKEAIRINPDFAQAHYNLGNSYSALKRFEEAGSAYKQAIRLEFGFAEAHLNLGAALHQLGLFEEAVESYKRAVRLKPLLPETHLNLGMTYLQMGDKGSALEEFKILKDLDKEMANRLFNLIYE